LNRDTAPVEQATGATLTMPHSAQIREATWMTERGRGGEGRGGAFGFSVCDDANSLFSPLLVFSQHSHVVKKGDLTTPSTECAISAMAAVWTTLRGKSTA
jgi:hypothetical protein